MSSSRICASPQPGAVVVSPADAHRQQARGPGHFHVVTRIPHHHRAMGRHARLGQSGAQHRGMRFGGVIIGHLLRDEQGTQTMPVEQLVEPLARLARRDTQQQVGDGVQLFEHARAHADKAARRRRHRSRRAAPYKPPCSPPRARGAAESRCRAREPTSPRAATARRCREYPRATASAIPAPAKAAVIAARISAWLSTSVPSTSKMTSRARGKCRSVTVRSPRTGRPAVEILGPAEGVPGTGHVLGQRRRRSGFRLRGLGMFERSACGHAGASCW